MNEIHYRSTRLFTIWHGMKSRCHTPSASRFSFYGGKGIHVCSEWKTSFFAFRTWANSNGYQDDLEIDRLDSAKDYEPSNCRWATESEQNQNKGKCKGTNLLNSPKGR